MDVLEAQAHTLMKHIDAATILASAPSNAGTVYVDHDNCPAGRDTKKRLCLTRKADGSVMAFCHHCGGKGYLRHVPRTGVVVQPRTIQPLIPKLALNEDMNSWPPEARGWLAKYDLSTSDLDFAYSTEYDRVVLPVYSYDGVLVAQQLRAIFPLQQPKYLTRGNPNGGHWAGGAGHGHVVVVEDILSATKVGHYCDAVALLRTSISPGVVNEIVANYSTASVWLDPDAAGKEATVKVLASLSALVPTAPIFAPLQPKEADRATIRTILDGSIPPAIST